MSFSRLPCVVFSVGVVALLTSLAVPAHAATTTYTSVYAGGTIAPGDTVLLNNGATVTGNVTANGALQFNQSAGNTLTISNMISGTGTLSLTNTGTLNLTGTSRSANTVVLDMTTSASAGVLQIRSGTGALWVGDTGNGQLNVNGGLVSNTTGILGNAATGVGTATVSSGTWANSGSLTVGGTGRGTLNVDGGYVSNTVDGILGRSAGSVGTATVSSGTWANRGNFTVGSSGTGTLNVTGGYVSNTQAYLGNAATGVGTATVSSGTWANSNSLVVGSSGTGTLNVTGGYVSNTLAYLGSLATGVGTVTVSSGTWANSGNLTVGNAGTGTLNVTGGYVSSVSVALGYSVAAVGTATVSSGTWASGGLVVGNSGTGTLNVTGGYVSSVSVALGNAATAVGTATVSSGTWANSGNLTVGNAGTGTLNVTGGLVSVSGTLFKGSDGTINLNAGGTLQIGVGGTTGGLGVATTFVNNGTLIFNRSDAITIDAAGISGTGTIQNVGTGTTTLTGQTSFTQDLGATAGRLIAGSSSSLNGFSTNGGLATVSGATLELKSKGLAYVNGLSTLAGGTILATNGISLGAGANVVGTGAISGDVSAAYGSWIEADGGKLTVGKTSSYVGFASDGRLYTNANEVELLDRNEAVLGSLTQLGDGSSGGTLRAANGMLLPQGNNLAGRGTVYGNFVNQGHVYGDGSSAGQEIVFAAGSTVSGIGTFENVVFNGTYSPGNSPAITNVTNGQFAAASSLLIELGGTQPGTQYDRVVDSSSLTLLGGTLDVVLYNGFVPTVGNSFEILQYGQLSGDFGTVNYPALSGGLSWERTISAFAMTITVVPEPSTIAALASGIVFGCWHVTRRRRAD